jgi:hypothetical protein
LWLKEHPEKAMEIENNIRAKLMVTGAGSRAVESDEALVEEF